MVRSRRGVVAPRTVHRPLPAGAGRRLGPPAVAAVLLPAALVWVQLLVTGIALGRVTPGGAPVGWTVTAAGAVTGGLVTLAGTALTVRALLHRDEAPRAARLLGAVPAVVVMVVQVGSGLLAPGVRPGAVAAQAAAVTLGALAGALLGTGRATDPPAAAVRTRPDPAAADRLLISEEPR